jgi:hypothetical protein
MTWGVVGARRAFVLRSGPLEGGRMVAVGLLFERGVGCATGWWPCRATDPVVACSWTDAVARRWRDAIGGP